MKMKQTVVIIGWLIYFTISLFAVITHLEYRKSSPNEILLIISVWMIFNLGIILLGYERRNTKKVKRIK